MLYIAHRINRKQDLQKVPTDYGIEVDLRDFGERIVLQHDPFIHPDAEDFEAFLEEYRHALIILNVKSERIEWRVLELMAKYSITNYFFLDSSFPMIRSLIHRGEKKIAVRFSEFEPIESALALAGQVEWVWIDCFTKLPLNDENYAQLKKHFKLCIVSPELQGRDTSQIAEYASQLRHYTVEAICSKRPDLWKEAFAT